MAEIQRSDVPREDTWDLDILYQDITTWQADLDAVTQQFNELRLYQGKLGESVETLHEFLSKTTQTEIQYEKILIYAMLQFNSDGSNNENQMLMAKIQQTNTQISTCLSFFDPEFLRIPDEKVQQFLKNPLLADYRISLNKLLRYKKHIRSEEIEEIFAMQTSFTGSSSSAFNLLNDVDLKFGDITTPEGVLPLTHSLYGSILHNADRDLRKTAYFQYYQQYDMHKNTIASLYNSEIQKNVFMAKVRHHSSHRHAALFADNVPIDVYDSLINTVHQHFPSHHAYYKTHARALQLEQLNPYDIYAPICADIKTEYTYEEAVAIIIAALQPLGTEYCDILQKGLTTQRWVDRYENAGKTSGAFSSGSYSTYPYILMNYRSDNLRDMFTLIHEAGHSMHSWYSRAHNPYPNSNYTIFEAEVASTFNEALLFEYLTKTIAADNPQMKLYLLANRISDINSTLFRQTMFAEYEMRTHHIIENNEALPLERMREEYATLQKLYFGDIMQFEDISNLEFLRIPHFYRAFYVYKYATGICAAMTLSNQVLTGVTGALDKYLQFLRSGGTQFPIDSLQTAGVDMATTQPIETALQLYSNYITELDALL